MMKTVAVAVVLALWVLGCAPVAGQLETPIPAGIADVDFTGGVSDADAAPVVPEPTPEPAGESEPPLPEGEPVRVLIPAIDVDAELVRLGLHQNRQMEVPDFGLAGWYAEGPKPGHRGPAVIAAHVDSRSGPDVFFRLRELMPGDEVHVIYDSGDEVTFAVSAEPVRTPKDELPGDEIWPVTSERLLTLITCGGAFDRSIGHYEDNVIVFTEPAPSP